MNANPPGSAWKFQSDRQIWLKPIPPESLPHSDRLARYRRSLLLRSVGKVMPLAASFHERVRDQSALPEVRRDFVAASLATERAVRICEVGGLISRQTAAAARQMFDELRNESFQAIERLQDGVGGGPESYPDNSHATEFFRQAQSRIDWLRKLAEQTMKIKQPAMVAELPRQSVQPRLQ